jgi:hypothetical protein
MSSYREYKSKALSDPAVKAEYDALQPEYDIISAMIEARNSEGQTQKESKSGTAVKTRS